MSYRYLDHTADVGIVARGASLAAAITALGAGLVKLVAGDSPLADRDERRITVEADGADEAVVAYCNELLFLVETRRWLPARVVDLRCHEHGIEARLAGEAFDSARHELVTEVKAATFHGLRIAEDETGWEVQVIFDV
jgi:SHS2 domain-containing protein